MNGDSQDIQKGTKAFLNTYFGLTLQLALLVILLIVGIIYPIFFKETNLQNIFYTFVIYALLALGLALPTYVKHIDLSGGAVLALSAWIFALCAKEHMLAWGLVLAIAAGIVVGIINGVINSLIRMPSAVLTMVVSAAVTFVVSLVIVWIKNILMKGLPVTTENIDTNRPLAAVFMLCAALAAVLFLIFSTKLSKQDATKKRWIMLAYIGSSAISALAGYYFVLLYHFADPTMAIENTIYLLFLAGSLLASRFIKIRLYPIILALLAALTWTVFSNLLYLFSVNAFAQTVLQLVLAAVFVTLALLVQRRKLDEEPNVN